MKNGRSYTIKKTKSLKDALTAKHQFICVALALTLRDNT